MTAFPDVRWGSETSRLRGPLIRFAGTRLGSAAIKLLTPLDRRLLLRSHGRYTVLGPVGAHVLLYSAEADKLRATLQDVMGRSHVDAGTAG